MTDDEIDTTDIAPLTERFFQRAKKRVPEQRVSLTVRVDGDLLDWFKAQGENYEQRINAALRIYMEAHETARRR